MRLTEYEKILVKAFKNSIKNKICFNCQKPKLKNEKIYYQECIDKRFVSLEEFENILRGSPIK